MAQDFNKIYEWYKKEQSPEAVHKILDHLNDVINVHINRHRSSGVLPVVLKANAERIIVDALPKYDPKKSDIRTFADRQLEQLKRVVVNNQFKYIPEARYSGMSGFVEIYNQMKSELGREPSAAEIADRTGTPLTEVSRYLREMIPNIAEGYLSYSPATYNDTATKLLYYVYFDLNPEERLVFEYIYGINGRPKIDNMGQIATLTGMSNSKISRIKNSIAEKMKPYEALL